MKPRATLVAAVLALLVGFVLAGGSAPGDGIPVKGTTVNQATGKSVSGVTLITPRKGFGKWTPNKVVKLNGDAVVGELPAEHQLFMDATLGREVDQPRLVYMPEKDKLMLVVNHSNPPLDTMLFFSDDHGTTWGQPVLVGSTGAVGYLGNGKVLVGGQYSDDYGRTWHPRVFPPASTGGPFYQWGDYLADTDSNGKLTRLVAPGYTERKSGEWPGTLSLVRFSYDGGLTWSGEFAPPSWNGGSGVGVSEVALRRARNGTIIAACRIKHREYQGKIDHYGGLGISLSKDDGHTWSKLKILYDYGRMHPSMALLPNGDIVMVYDVRLGWLDKEKRLLDADGNPQWSVEAILSRDHGETWDLTHRTVLAQWSGAYHVQDTSTVLLPDGSLLTAFGAGYRAEPGPTYKASNATPAGNPIFGGFPACGPLDVALVRWRPGVD